MARDRQGLQSGVTVAESAPKALEALDIFTGKHAAASWIVDHHAAQTGDEPTRR
jgi:hypothetical protein